MKIVPAEKHVTWIDVGVAGMCYAAVNLFLKIVELYTGINVNEF